ncbi:hypothetical protein NPIL_120281 [Nephila pilipes]|uniref:Uncharacterized protein n=1 Tax=Nephila pilipes TaxID=299642 RepID=A0A8X6TJ64_NEPPI|nr:hypothetical protein NPIL_120281 [Nephila pilipes]
MEPPFSIHCFVVACGSGDRVDRKLDQIYETFDEEKVHINDNTNDDFVNFKDSRRCEITGDRTPTQAADGKSLALVLESKPTQVYSIESRESLLV